MAKTICSPSNSRVVIPSVFPTNGQRNITSIVDQAGGETFFTYGPDNEVLSTTDPLGRTIQYQYDTSLNMISLTDSIGLLGSTVYDTQGRPISSTDTAGNVTQYEYTSGVAGPTRIIHPDQTFTSYTYDAYGLVVGIENENGESTTTVRDSSGRILSSTNALGQTSTFEYEGLFPSKTTAFNGLTEEYLYDSDRNRIRSTDSEGNVFQFEYDLKRRLTKSIDPLGRETEKVYRDDGMIDTIIAPRR